MKKLAAFSISALLIVALFSGCAPKETDTLVIWSNMQVEADTLKALGDKWSEESGYKIEVVYEGPDVQQFVQASNNPGGPDALVGIPNDQLANYVVAGLAAEVPDGLYQDADFVDASIQACYVEGKKYGAPLAVESLGLFYNTSKMEKAPETWDEMIAIAQEQGGIQFEATSIYYDLGFMRAFGSYIFDYQNGAYDVENMGLGNENAVKAYEYIKRLSSEYGFVSSDINSDIAKSNFQNGVTAFYIGGPWDVAGFTSAGTPFAVAPLPSLNGKDFVTPVGTQVCFVSAKSTNQEKAWDFILYLIEKGALDLYEAGDRIPARLDSQALAQIQNNAISQAFAEQISRGEPMPTVPELGQIWTPYSNNMKALLSGEIDAATAAQNIQKQIEEGIRLMNSGR